MFRRTLLLLPLALALTLALVLAPGCASKPKEPKKPAPAAPTPKPPAPREQPPENLPPVMLGIDVLEADGFKQIAGKKIGLLTHPAGVNRRGESTLDVIRLRARQTRLVALFAPEHGLDGKFSASVNFADAIHPPSGLPIYSLHGKTRKPTAAMLKGLDALVIDLQDIGSRSYTFSSAMLTAMAACFENNVEVIVLDRPNPLGGLKIDGPPLDQEWKSYVGALRVPYVHGLTMGEMALMAKALPRMLVIPKIIDVSDAVREKGRLTVVPMRGWTRSMRWPDTGLRWIKTSPLVPSFEAAVGYAMVGLGTEGNAWSHGIGKEHPFRGISYPKKTPDEIIRALEVYKIPGIRLVKRQAAGPDGKPRTGVYVEVVDWQAWRPTELSLYMHKLAAQWSPLNPYAALTAAEQRTFNIHFGSTAYFNELRTRGSRIDPQLFIKNWAERAAVYREQAKKFWLYRE